MEDRQSDEKEEGEVREGASSVDVTHGMQTKVGSGGTESGGMASGEQMFGD